MENSIYYAKIKKFHTVALNVKRPLLTFTSHFYFKKLVLAKNAQRNHIFGNYY